MTAPAGSEDAGLLLSAEEREVADLLYRHEWDDVLRRTAHKDHSFHAFCAVCAGDVVAMARLLGPLLAARVEAARAEERERIAAAIDEAPGFRRWIDDSRVVDKDVAIRIAWTLPPAGDDERGGV